MYEEKKIQFKKRPKQQQNNRKKFLNLKAKPSKTKKNTQKEPTIFSKIEWKKLFIKLGILILAVIIITFTISRINKYDKNTDFDDNIEIIKNAALEHFTLPKNIGDSSSLTLKELYNLKLISDIKENDKHCDYDNSYVILTKSTKEDYRLKIYLKCPKTKDIIEEKITCPANVCNFKK